MKKLLYVILSISSSTIAQTVSLTNRPEWKVTFHVADEDGKPVSGADAKVAYYIKPPPGKSTAMDSVQGKTDTNGLFVATGRSHFMLSCSVKKEGYYPAAISYELGLAYQYDPVKWNPTLKLELKKIKNPIPMYARKAQIQIPENEKPIGFDLEEYDWVAPYGRGRRSDFIFQSHRRWESRRDFDSNLKVTFSNHGDGLISMPVPLDKGSELRLPHTAPLIGYASELSKRLSSTPGKAWTDDVKENQNYFFRIRTVMNEKGEIRSALYGKMHGDFVTDPINSKTTIILFTYYLNPAPDSQNVEFDPKQNLFKDLPSGEQVDAP